MDKIKIDNLEVFAHHGVFPEETEEGQLFYVNAVLHTKTRQAGKQDDLELSTHYGEVCHFIHDYMTAHTFQLIETVAEQMAEAILLHYGRIKGIELEIRKPEAPIGLPFESVSVVIYRQWSKVYLAFGSNLGDRDRYLEGAIRSIQEHPLCRNSRVSAILRSMPYGMEEQGEFLNGALEVETLLPPEELLDFLHELEAEAGRERTVHWGPRTLDLDIILYEDWIVDSEVLTIPHADMQNRDFVLQPLAEIAGYVRHPVTQKTIREMLLELGQAKNSYLI